MNFEHLTSKKLKSILNGNPTANQMSWAIQYTEKCLEDDETNEDVSYSVLEKRLERFTLAKCLFDKGLNDQSLNLLRKTWE